MIAIAPEALANLTPAPKDGFERYMTREPVGVVFTIAPWNYPYLTTVNSVIPALMAGNTVVLKHASHTLLVAERFQKAFDKAGLPKGVFQHLVLNHEQTGQIISSGLVNAVCFTGSVEGGRVIERAAAGRFLHVGLELGGKDPAYVRADANLAHAVENLVDGLLQLGPELLRHRTHLCSQGPVEALHRRFHRPDENLRARQPLGRSNHAGPHDQG
jgi:acyl-CoA reductase-like NAD-dependent aldehyde dehydrogenase